MGAIMMLLRLLMVKLLHNWNIIIYGNNRKKKLKRTFFGLLILFFGFIIFEFLVFNISIDIFSKLGPVLQDKNFIVLFQMLLFGVALFMLFAGLTSDYRNMIYSPYIEFLLAKPVPYTAVYFSEILSRTLIGSMLLIFLVFPILYSYDLLYDINIFIYFAVYLTVATFIFLIVVIRLIMSTILLKTIKTLFISRLIRMASILSYLFLIFLTGVIALKLSSYLIDINISNTDSYQTVINNLLEIKFVGWFMAPFNLITKSLYYAVNGQFNKWLLNLAPVALLSFSIGVVSINIVKKMIKHDNFSDGAAHTTVAGKKSTTFDSPFLSLNILKKDITLTHRQRERMLTYVFIPLLVIITSIITIKVKGLEINEKYHLILFSLLGLIIIEILFNSSMSLFSIDVEGKQIYLFKMMRIYRSLFMSKFIFAFIFSLAFSLVNFLISVSLLKLGINEILLGFYLIIVGAATISSIWISSTFYFPNFDWEVLLSDVPSNKANFMGNTISSVYILIIGLIISLFVIFHINVLLLIFLIVSVSLMISITVITISLRKINKIDI